MTRLLFPLLAAALFASFVGCASGERHPGVKLRRSDALYAGETYGDPARRREREDPGPLGTAGVAFRRLFSNDESR